MCSISDLSVEVAYLMGILTVSLTQVFCKSVQVFSVKAVLRSGFELLIHSCTILNGMEVGGDG